MIGKFRAKSDQTLFISSETSAWVISDCRVDQCIGRSTGQRVACERMKHRATSSVEQHSVQI
jgi:hypothetical protein